MARNQSAIVNWSQYLALRAVAGFVDAFDVGQSLDAAATIGSLFFKSNARRRARAEGNIAAAFPEWSPERISDIAERSMQHMFQMFMVDALVTPRLITPQSWPDYIELGEIGLILDRLASGEPMLVVSGHCGNWELAGYALSVLGFPVTAIARPIDNPLINTWLTGIREARGMKILTKWGATSELQRIITRGGRVGFVADQNAGDQGMFVPFFGRLASCYKSIGLLAIRYKVPIATGFARRVGQQLSYEIGAVDLILPEHWRDLDDPLFYITARISWMMEQMVREAPEQYLWVHRRWKSRPRWERQGKPMPQRMVEKLHTLPWLECDDVERIVDLSNNSTSLYKD